MTTGKRVMPTTTCGQARVALFQPTQRPTSRSDKWANTSHGRCLVTGRLGQRHADLIECILYVAERKRDTSDGLVELLVDPHQLRTALSDTRYSQTHIIKMFRELQEARVEIFLNNWRIPTEKIKGILIDSVSDSPKTRHNPLNGGERHLLRVKLGSAMVMMIEHDLHKYYDPRPIVRLQYGVSQAVARYILTHQNVPNGGWFMDTLICAVSGKVYGNALRNSRRRLRSDADALYKIGIEIDGKKVKKLVDNQVRVTNARGYATNA